MKIIAFSAELTKSYEQNKKFNEAINTWRIIITHCQHINKILPLVSIIGCLLKIGELDEAIVSSVELVSLLESAADQILPIKEECDRGICEIVENFVEFKQCDVIFQLLQCRFTVLKLHYNGEVMLSRMVNVSFLMTEVAIIVKSPAEIKLFTKKYKFLDDILLFMQNSPTTNMSHEIKCEHVSAFLHNYGYCCNKVKDYFRATMLFNQAIASRKLVFGDKSNNNQCFGHYYNSLGFALENSNHLLEAKTAYKTSIEIYKQARDYKNEEEKNESISTTINHLQRLEKKLNNK